MATEKSDCLRRVLFLIAMDPSMKFGSLEEQCIFPAKEFKRRGSLFLPVFVAPLGPVGEIEYQAAKLQAENLNLIQFNFRTLLQLLRLVRRHKIELVHWNFYSPINRYLWFLTVFKP